MTRLTDEELDGAIKTWTGNGSFVERVLIELRERRAAVRELARLANELWHADRIRRVDGRVMVAVEVGWLATLVHNLAVAGFGQLMFKAGDNFGFHMGADDLSQCTCQWSPGRGEPYRPSNRCEQEDWDDETDEGCVLGKDCLAADPFHTSDECFDAEMAEAYMAPEHDGGEQP